MKNNNTAVIHRLIRRNLKANRKRNFFLVAAIALTTLLLGSIFSIGFSILDSVKMEQLRLSGTTAHAAVGRPTASQLEQLKQLPYVKSVGTGYQVADIRNTPEMGGAYLFLHFFDKTDWEQFRAPANTDIMGDYPQAEDEIMASRGALDLLGIHEPVVGMEIPLSYCPGGEENDLQNKTFRLSGWFTSYSLMTQTDSLLVSEAFAEKFEASREKYLAADILFVEEKQVSEYFERLKLDLDIPADQAAAVSQSNERGEEAQVPMLLALGAVAVFFILTGYLLIYNVLYISVSRDVRFYGLLKTLGTTPKQLKRLVVGQILRLCMIGIPSGASAAFLFSVIAIPAAIGAWKFVSTGAVLSFSPIIYFGAAAFALCTSLLGAFLPAKKAAEVSPVEAQKFTGISRPHLHRPAHGKPYKMALRNIFRNRKRAAVVLLSLFLGITAFTAVTTLAYSMGVDQYIDSLYQNDFVLYDQSLFSDQPAQPFDDSFMEQIAALPGLESCHTLLQEYMQLGYSPEEFGEYAESRLEKLYEGKEAFTEEDIRKSFIGFLVGIDGMELTELQSAADQKIDISAFDRGEIALIATDNPAYFPRVSQLHVTPMELSTDGENPSHGTEVQIPFGGFAPQSLESDGSLAPTIVVSKSFLSSLYHSPAIREIRIDVADGYEKQALEALKQISGNNSAIRRVSKIEAVSVMSGARTVMLVLGGGAALLLAFVGILNFINVMSMDITVRKMELAILESIGMEKRKVRRMLLFEGLGYAVMTLLLSATLGNGAVYGIFTLFKLQVDYATFTYPILPVGLVFLMIFTVCLIVPEIIYRSIAKATLIERLREKE